MARRKTTSRIVGSDMSQPNNHNYQSFASFNEPVYDSHQPSANQASLSQWPSQQPQAVSVRSSSPSSSARTPRTTVPHLGSHVAKYSQPTSHLHASDASLDPQLDAFPMLPTFQGHHTSNALQSRGNVTPLERFFQEQPWSAVSMRNPTEIPSVSGYLQPSMIYGPFRPGSDADDSGYNTRPPTHSVVGSDSGPTCQELASPEMTYTAGPVHFSSLPTGMSDPVRSMKSPNSADSRSHYSGRSRPRSTASGKEFPCLECKEILKCQSDYKKHMLRHHKPFRCEVTTCRKSVKGFGTVNDLNRHRKSVHGIGADENSYQCASESCRNKTKVWPRLDNFKQHLERMHGNEDKAELIRRSHYQPEDSKPTPSVPSMETALAGIGTERQYSSNEFDDPASGIRLSPDQETSQWTPSDLNLKLFPTEGTDSGTFLWYTKPLVCDDGTPDCNLQEPATTSKVDLSTLTVPPGDTLQSLETLTQQMASYKANPDRSYTRHVPHLSSAAATQMMMQGTGQSSARGLVKADPDHAHNTMRHIPPLLRDELYTPTFNDRALTHSLDEKRIAMDSEELDSEATFLPSAVTEDTTKKCEECPRTFHRPCDLKKHMTTHTKPWACTALRCDSSSSRKSDWQRHEEKLHGNPSEIFCCQPLAPSQNTPCSRMFKNRELFLDHLKNQHRIADHKLREQEANVRRFGSWESRRFWCGFCRTILAMDAKGHAAKQIRFDHIGDHLYKEKRKIDDWFCVEEKMTRAELRRFEELDVQLKVEEFDDEATVVQSPPQFSDLSSTQTPQQIVLAASIPQKRHVETEYQEMHFMQKYMRFDRYCCSCGDGPWNLKFHGTCFSCQHQLCKNCSTMEVNTAFMDNEMADDEQWTGDF